MNEILYSLTPVLAQNNPMRRLFRFDEVENRNVAEPGEVPPFTAFKNRHFLVAEYLRDQRLG